LQIVDTHQHLWELDRFSYSWCYTRPGLDRSFRLSDYLAATQGINIEKTVHVEADVDERDISGETDYILSIAERGELIAGVVAASRPEHEGFDAYITGIANRPHLKGLRRLLHTEPDELSEQRLFVENVRSLSKYGLSFDICVLARQLPKAIKLVKACPDVSFVLDHAGNPRIKEHESQPWEELMEEIAGLPNVACKVSGMVTNADWEKWKADDLRPYVNHVIECFGWDRVMFGSDWPVCTLASTFGDWYHTLVELTRDAGEVNQRKLFHDNACRIYRL
jgi:predicted TIM-barrel fold metal-dependent hydrolase